MVVVPVEKKLSWKNPPIILFLLISLNILIFIFYQSDDHRKMEMAFDEHQSFGFFEQEKLAYKDYLHQLPEADQLQSSFFDEDDISSYEIISDLRFEKFLKANKTKYISEFEIEKWALGRQGVEKTRDSISFYQNGLIPENMSLRTLLTSQFLHGGLMHLVGNMVFLFLFGFAIEGALGRFKFLLFYLLSGIGAGAFYSWYAKYSGGDTLTTLVGASGSISGVMAMYVALYRLKKIEFFYWLFFVVGYFRAPALLLLPIYIGFEAYQLITVEGSNVAYTAHMGGFLAGGLLILLTHLFLKKSIDQDYLDNVVHHSPIAIGLDKIYKELGSFKLTKALHMTNEMIKTHGPSRELEELRLKLIKGVDKDNFKQTVLQSLEQGSDNEILIDSQLEIAEKLTSEEGAQLTFNQLANLAMAAVSSDNIRQAEKYLDRAQSFLKDSHEGALDVRSARHKLALVSRRMANFCHKYNRSSQADKYTKLADTYLASSGEVS